MKVPIVGGSGLIGRHLASSLIGDGADVLVVTRDVDRARRRGAVGQLAVWSTGDPRALASALSAADAVVNLAGVPIGPWPWWLPGRRRAIVRSRIESTRAIVEALRLLPDDRRPHTLVSVSGTDGYEGMDSVPATESTPFSDGFLARLCRAWEGEARRASELGVRVAIVRIGFVIGRGVPALGIYALPFRLGMGGPLGSGQQWMTWVHIDDVVGVLRLALSDDSATGPMNAVSPEPARQYEVAAAIGAALGRRSWLRVPAPLIRMTMGEAAILPLGSRRVVPARALELGYRHRWTDLGRAMYEALG